MEHSENNFTTQSGLFENEIESGMFQCSVQQTQVLQDTEGRNHVQLIMYDFCPYSINYLLIVCLFNAKLEHSRPNLVLEARNNFIFGMLYSPSEYKMLNHVTWSFKAVGEDPKGQGSAGPESAIFHSN